MQTLSPRELSVMVMVSQGHDRKTISSRLCISPKTVSTYRSRVMRKLGASSDVEAGGGWGGGGRVFGDESSHGGLGSGASSNTLVPVVATILSSSCS